MCQLRNAAFYPRIRPCHCHGQNPQECDVSKRFHAFLSARHISCVLSIWIVSYLSSTMLDFRKTEKPKLKLRNPCVTHPLPPDKSQATRETNILDLVTYTLGKKFKFKICDNDGWGVTDFCSKGVFFTPMSTKSTHAIKKVVMFWTTETQRQSAQEIFATHCTHAMRTESTHAIKKAVIFWTNVTQRPRDLRRIARGAKLICFFDRRHFQVWKRDTGADLQFFTTYLFCCCRHAEWRVNSRSEHLL